MIVCPNCRNANDEEAAICARCGAPLTPGPVLLQARRAPAERPPIEIPQPRPPSPWRAIAVLGVLIGVALGVGAWYVLRPNPCEGTNFTSSRFGYCLRLPDDWEWSPARFGSSVTVDQFSPPSQTATVLVEAADLPDDVDLARFADTVRQRDQEAGLSPGPIAKVTVDGAEGFAWDIAYTSGAGQDYAAREVVVVRDHFGWRLMLNDTASAFDHHAAQFDQMVRSFRFR